MTEPNAFAVPDCEFAAKMPLETVLAVASRLEKKYHRVSSIEGPAGYHTIRAWGIQRDVRVINSIGSIPALK